MRIDLVPVDSIPKGSNVVLMAMTRHNEKLGVLVCTDGLGDDPIPWERIGSLLARDGGKPWREDSWCPMTEAEASFGVMFTK